MDKNAPRKINNGKYRETTPLFSLRGQGKRKIKKEKIKSRVNIDTSVWFREGR